VSFSFPLSCATTKLHVSELGLLDCITIMSSTSTLPASVSSSQAVFQTCLGSVIIHSVTQWGLVAVVWTKPRSFSNISTCSPYIATCQAMSHCLSWASNKFFLSSYVFKSASLAQLHNISNAATLPVCAAQCHTVLPSSFLASNNLFFNSSGLSCNSLV